jgi:predicted Rossmann fold flavoprotein
MKATDVVVIGGGAAGLMCAITAARRGRRVVVLEGSNKPGKKILMSGGGRCNFTHLHSTHANFLSANPHFCKSALARYTPYDFLEMVETHGVAYHEKSPGQLFCDRSSKDILNMLLDEAAQASVTLHTHSPVVEVTDGSPGYRVISEKHAYETESLVVASGGLSIPKMGATDLGYRLARQFGLDVLPTRAGLVPFTFSGALHEMMSALSGVSVQARASCGSTSFTDGLLFTHRGLSGPAALQISSFWQPGESITLDMSVGESIEELLRGARESAPRKKVASVLSQVVPRALAEHITDDALPASTRTLADFGNQAIGRVAAKIHDWTIKPAATEGYRTAEVTLGGVDTRKLSSQTMASLEHENLYFVGEVVDVTGHLGGHNFQWAWASGYAAGEVA